MSAVHSLCLVFIMIVSIGCTDVRLKGLNRTTIFSSKSELCVRPPENRVRLNKVLFIVDKSGSNVNDGGVGGEGNDPDDIRRADNIQAFLNQYRNEPYYRWGYIVFGVETNRAQAYINDGNVNNPVFGDANDMQAAIDQHRAVADDGCTPYLAALELAKNAIENDLRANPQEDSVYNIFFMSDGFPNDANDANGCGSTNPVENNDNDPYIQSVKDLVRISPDRIFLSTAYYATQANDPGRAAATGLEYMAQAGQGNFADLQGNDQLNFDELKLGPRPESWMMKRMVIYNLNGAQCTDGSTGADSDADGLCDKDEIEFNTKFSHQLDPGEQFDPTNRNSLHNQYSDLFSYKFDVLPTGEGLNNCNLPRIDKDKDLLNECEERALFDNQANGPTMQWSEQMRDEGYGSANPLNPDTDGDGFLDSLEYFTFGVKSAPVNYNNIFDRYSGGVTAETIIEEHRNPMTPENTGLDTNDFKVNFAGINSAGENCYSVKLNRIALYSTQEVGLNQVSQLPELVHEKNENVVLLYYIAVPERNPNGKGYLFYSFQKFRKDKGWTQEFTSDNFLAYKVPEFF